MPLKIVYIITKFEELTDIITRNRNKGKDKSQSTNDYDDDQEIEVVGNESTKAPQILFASDEQDMGLTDQLYYKAKHTPNRGEFAESCY